MRQIGFQDAAAQFLRRVSNGVDRTDDAVHQWVHVERAAVGEVWFGRGPNSFVGVEVGSVGGKVLGVQARVWAEESGQRWAVVGGGVVEQNDDRSTEVSATGQCPTKPAHGDAALRANRHSPSVEAYAFPPEGDCIALFMQMPIMEAQRLFA